MPLEELGQQPTSLLWIGPFPPLGGDALREPGDEGGNLLLALGGRPRGRRLGLLARAWQPWPDLASKIQAACLQPVPEPQIAHDVVAVVAGDGAQDLLARLAGLGGAAFEPLLERDDARPGAAQLHLALEAVQRLEPLDRVALDAGADALANDPVEVDEDPRPEQAIDLRL